MKNNKIAVIGSGAWGTAIANVLIDNDYEVYIYGNNQQEIDEINNCHTNSGFFSKDIVLPFSLVGTTNIIEAVKDAFMIVLAIPSYATEEIINKIKPLIDEKVYIVNLTKGFHPTTKMPVGRYIRTLLPPTIAQNVISISGPSFALEVIKKYPTSVVACSDNYRIAKKIQNVFTNAYFKVHPSTDSIGVEYCGALKNIIAIACGIAEGLGYKDNTRAMIITKGLLEISRFVTFFGGDEKTCYALAGIGDLLLTCTSTTSRNYMAGYLIGKRSITEFLKENKKTVEGLFACEIAYSLAISNNIYAPIITAIYHVYKGDYDAQTMIKNILEEIIE